MLRLVERLFGDGEISEQGVLLARAGYMLAVYRDWQQAADELIPGEYVIEGHLMADPETLARLVAPLTPRELLLDDGRRLLILIVSADGAIMNVEGATFT
ncbi:MAG: hypothetical protein GEU99_17795 [Luteitalea sp.]|nr:hypothetical protein [Luteitalea sp.]